MNERGVVRASELGARVGMPLRLTEREPCQDRLFEGRLSWLKLRSGLSLHCSDCVELHHFTTQVQTAPHINFILFLEGGNDVGFDEHRFHLGTGPDAAAQGVTIALGRPTQFSRQARRGQRIRKVSVSLTPDWFEAGGFDSHEALHELIDLERDTFMLRQWQPSPRLLALAEQVLAPQQAPDLLQRLYLESRALEIANEALSLLARQSPRAGRGLRPQEMARIRRTLELLHSDSADGWSLERIAREVGTNASTLQRHFQAAQGVSLFEYQRRRKLQQAREALERQGVSVGQAAWLAGYSSAANFSTAFKRAFGLTPKQVRPRL